MHSLISLLAVTIAAADPWSRILDSVNMDRSRVLTPEQHSAMTIGDANARAEKGAIVVLVGESDLARSLGFHATKKRVVARSVLDVRNPKLSIIWEQPVEIPVFETPAGAILFAKERWTEAPLMAAVRKGSGAVLWLAVGPGEKGYERFPYIPQTLAELGLRPSLSARDLWAFFDSSYRSRVDVDYFAEQWRKAGVRVLHVAAWHYNEPDPQRDAYLEKLIEACHRRAILVYAWLELPHVSERFWNDHPEWREKTAAGQDAHLDWRKLMNLVNPDCHKAAVASTRSLIQRFDWDGVNLAELYFESLEGAANPARFTPMNQDVRRAYIKEKGIDPVEAIKRPGSEAMRDFLEYRAELARKLQSDWIAEIESLRVQKPHLDLVLTHVDDRFDSRMKEAIGADAARVLPLLETHDFTFLIEDPATIWHLGPERYPQIAERYKPLTARTDRLAIDINIVERYQDVYPTKQQTGSELFQLVNLASRAFPKVALYFENSILKPDLALLPAAAATGSVERNGTSVVVESERMTGLPWNGPAMVDGLPWPVQEESFLWLPPGRHTVTPAPQQEGLHMIDINADLQAAKRTANGIEFVYQSSSRAIARFDRTPAAIEVDGLPLAATGSVVMLPRGRHAVTVQ